MAPRLRHLTKCDSPSAPRYRSPGQTHRILCGPMGLSFQFRECIVSRPRSAPVIHARRVLGMGKPEHDTHDIRDAQKQKSTKREVEGKTRQFIHVALLDASCGKKLPLRCYKGIDVSSKRFTEHRVFRYRLPPNEPMAASSGLSQSRTSSGSPAAVRRIRF